MTDKQFLSQFPVVVREFAAYKMTIQGCSEKTVNEYLLDLRTFMRYIIADAEDIDTDSDAFEKIDISQKNASFFENITTTQIYEFLYYVDKTRGNENKAKARKLSAIKALYKYLTVKVHAFENNPAVNIETPKLTKTLPKYLSVDESISLLSSIENDTESKTKERDFAIITLFLNCGMRLSELCGINLSDIDSKMSQLTVMGKGAKERTIYLNDACRDALNNYLPIRIKTPTKGDNALFLSSRAQRISNKTVQYIVKKYLSAAGLDYKHYSTHKLRHTAATLMYQSGKVDVRVLKDILGHEQLNTTQIYTHVSDTSAARAVEANPLSHVKAKQLEESNPADDDDSENE